MGHLNSMNIFLRQEIDRMQKVIKLVRNSLNDLKLAIEGTIIMSEVTKYIIAMYSSSLGNKFRYVLYLDFYSFRI